MTRVLVICLGGALLCAAFALAGFSLPVASLGILGVTMMAAGFSYHTHSKLHDHMKPLR